MATLSESPNCLWLQGEAQRFRSRNRGSRPEGAYRGGGYPFGKLVGVRSRVQHHPRGEPIAELVAHPCQVGCVALVWGASGFDLNTRDPVGSDLGNDVHFMASLLGPQMVELVTLCSYTCLRSQLGSDEAVEEPPQKASCHSSKSTGVGNAASAASGEAKKGAASSARSNRTTDAAKRAAVVVFPEARGPTIMTADTSSSNSSISGSAKRVK